MTACDKLLPCGHYCGGLRDDTVCLPCLHGCVSTDAVLLLQDADDMCMICFTDTLSAAPVIKVPQSVMKLLSVVYNLGSYSSHKDKMYGASIGLRCILLSAVGLCSVAMVTVCCSWRVVTCSMPTAVILCSARSGQVLASRSRLPCVQFAR
jgi:hypothetical protein